MVRANLGWIIPHKHITNFEHHVVKDEKDKLSGNYSNQIIVTKNYFFNKNKGIIKSKRNKNNELNYSDFIIENNYNLYDCFQKEQEKSFILRLGTVKLPDGNINLYFASLKNDNYMPFTTMTSKSNDDFLIIYNKKSFKGQQIIPDNYPFIRIKTGQTNQYFPIYIKTGKVKFKFDNEEYEVKNFFLHNREKKEKILYKRLFIFKYQDIDLYCKFLIIKFDTPIIFYLYDELSLIGVYNVKINSKLMRNFNKYFSSSNILRKKFVEGSTNTIRVVNVLMKDKKNNIRKGYGFYFLKNKFTLIGAKNYEPVELLATA